MTESRQNVRTRTTRRAPSYDIDVVGRLDRVTAPKQQRSEQSLQRVLGALESLLQSKAFANISIPEIASGAGCSAATIYGRFKDKASILAALHESLREKMIEDVDRELDPNRWAGRDFGELATHYCGTTVAFYRRNRNLLAAVLLIQDREVYERAASTVQHIAARLAETSRVAMSTSQHSDLDSRVDLGIRAVFALLQQRLLFEPVRLSSINKGDDATFSDELARLLIVMVQRP